MGVGLAGLAMLDPVVANDPTVFHAVLLGTLSGSVIPDIDTVLKLRNNAVYIRNHRGITHSVPATLLWPFVISSSLMLFYHDINFVHLLLWTFLAVFLHVFVDIFNAYGTQAVRPFTNRWMALGIINIFDPFIFSLHMMGFLVWGMGGNPGITFATIYVMLAVYYVLRTIQHHRTVRYIKHRLPNLTNVYLSPTLKWSHYHVAAESDDHFYVGKVDGKRLYLIDTFERPLLNRENSVVREAVKDKNVRAFLSFSPIYRWEIQEKNGGYEMRFIDLRYFAKGTYPFTATVWLDESLDVQCSFTGWVYSEQKLHKKLVLAQTK